MASGSAPRTEMHLEMMLDFTFEGHVIANMTDYIGTILANFPEETTGM